MAKAEIISGIKHDEPVSLKRPESELDRRFANWYAHGPWKQSFLDIVDNYRPDEQWTARIVPHQNEQGVVLEISDTYRPPSQIDEAPKLNWKLAPGGRHNYLAHEIDAMVPQTALFTGKHVSGQLFADHFNRMGSSGTINMYDVHALVAEEWRERMGVSNTNDRFPRLTVAEKGSFSFKDLTYDSGVDRYGKNYYERDLANVGYSTVLAAHNLNHIPTDLGDFFFTGVRLGDQASDSYSFAIRNTTPDGARLPAFEVLTAARDLSPLLQESGILSNEDRQILAAIPPDSWNYGTLRHLYDFLDKMKRVDRRKLKEGLAGVLNVLPEGGTGDWLTDGMVNGYRKSFSEALEDEGALVRTVFRFNQGTSPLAEVRELSEETLPPTFTKESSDRIAEQLNGLASVRTYIPNPTDSFTDN